MAGVCLLKADWRRRSSAKLGEDEDCDKAGFSSGPEAVSGVEDVTLAGVRGFSGLLGERAASYNEYTMRYLILTNNKRA